MVADFGASIMRQVPAFRVASSKESILKSKPNPKSQSQASADVGPFATQPLPYSGAFTQASVSVLRHLAGLPATSASATTASAIAPARAIIRDESSGDVSVEVNPASARLSSAPYAFTAADELESVVHTVFTLIHPKLIGDALADWEQRCPRSRAHATALAAFWQHSMRAGAWREAVDAAHRVDYAAVAAALCRVLPGDIFWSGDDGGASTSRAEWGGESEDAWAAAEIAAIGRDQRSLFPGLFQ